MQYISSPKECAVSTLRLSMASVGIKVLSSFLNTSRCMEKGPLYIMELPILYAFWAMTSCAAVRKDANFGVARWSGQTCCSCNVAIIALFEILESCWNFS